MNESQPEIRYLGDLQKLKLDPGDVLVLQTDEHINTETRDRLRAALGEQLPGHKVLILGGGLKLGVVQSPAYTGG